MRNLRKNYLLATFAVFAFIVSALSLSQTTVHSQSTQPITGWAWSDTTGWITMYNLVRNSDDTVTGYAWSDNIGWIKFGGLSSFPTYAYATYTTPGNYIWTVPTGVTSVSVLVVAGGGGGGMDMGGGGGGGGVVYNASYATTPGAPISVTVGAGGAGAPAAGTGGQPAGHQYTVSATNGGNSVFGTVTAVGGGRGGSSYNAYTPGAAGGSGGSGGGASGYSDGTARSGGTGTAGQGFAGGNQGGGYYSGGGGGAAAVGVNGPAKANGGAGVLNAITGLNLYWGGGGGGSGYSIGGGDGGIGGGGGGAAGTTFGGGTALNAGKPGGGGCIGCWANKAGGDGGANTGGGGGGGSHYNATNKGGDGGSGIVIIRYTGGYSSSNATMTPAGVMSGWARACAGTSPGDCSSMTSRTDGWDGWISLSGTNYGVDTDSNSTYAPGTSGAWGSDVVGWIGFNLTVDLTPVITITATDSSATETAGNTGTFTLTSNLAPTSNLAVTYTISGSATNGTDYTTITNTRTITAGATTATVTITPIDDPTFEGSEAVTLTLVDGASYNLGSPSVANVDIADNESSGPPTGCISATANPTCDKNARVRAGSTDTLYWWTQNATTCTVTGTNGNSWSGTTSPSGGQATSIIQTITAYTLSCDSGAFTDRIEVKVVPTVKEI